MLHDLPASPAVTAVLDESGWQMDDLDSPTALDITVNVQIALLIAGVASARALIDDYGLTPEFVAGHSVGAFAAAVTAGVLTFAEALAAVELRGRSMEQACAQGNWGMAAVNGLPTRAAAEVVAESRTDDDPLWIANVNDATQTVVSGTGRALRRAAGAASRAGAQSCERLDVAVASHCPIQQDTARLMAEHLAQLPRRRPTCRYLTNTRGRVTASADVVLSDLAESVARPVQWYDGTRLLGELGVTSAVETPPGHVLTRLLALAVPSVAAMSLQDNNLRDAPRWVSR
jgi:malonate decarboxylase epsilon subunit